MKWAKRQFVLLLPLLVALGCKDTPPPAPPAPAQPMVSSAEPAAPETPPPQEPAANAEQPACSPPTEPAVEVEVETPAAVPSTYGVERIVVFAPQNPLIVELRLSIDGQPHVRALEQLVERALELADTDGDGRAMWSELTASPRFKYGQFGNLPIDGDNGPKQIVERYDIDRDGVIDNTELPRFLTRNAGGSRPFSIRGMVDDSPSGRRETPLWQLLDADDDGRLSAEEIATAAGRLRSRDADDDEILSAGEMLPPSASMAGEMMRTRRRGGREGARLLGPHAQWDGVRTSLEEQYALGGALDDDDFPLTPTLFPLLDASGDGRLQRKEFERLNDAPPDVILAVNLRTVAAPAATISEQAAEGAGETPTEAAAEEPAAAADEPMPPRIELVSFGEQLQGDKSATPLSGDRLLLQAAGSTLLIYLNDTLAAANYAQQAEQGLVRFDADKNGYLEASEVNEQAQATVGRFEAVDTDEDGKVYAGEIAAWLEQQQQALRSQVHARVEGKPDSLRETLDRNGDGRLDAREIDGAAERLRSLDANGDGEVDLDEMPTGLVMGIARGSLANQDALFVMPSTTPVAPTADAPRWFQQTDANRDGTISPREFLGPVELFERLDANGDGFLTADEARDAAG